MAVRIYNFKSCNTRQTEPSRDTMILRQEA